MTADAGGVGAPRFDVVLRGYDRRQVDEHVARLQRVMSRMRADLELVRSQPIPVVQGPPPGFGGPGPGPGPGQQQGGRPRPTPRPRPDEPDMIGSFTDRMQSILQAAEEEAAEIRSKARSAARAESDSVRAELADLVRQRDVVLNELTRLRGQLEGLLGAPTARMAAAPREVANARPSSGPGPANAAQVPGHVRPAGGPPKPRPGPAPAGAPKPAGPPKPGGQQPSTVHPGVSQPGVSQPGVSQPGVSQPGVSQPGVPQQGVPKPGTPQPVSARPGPGRSGGAQQPSGPPLSIRKAPTPPSPQKPPAASKPAAQPPVAQKAPAQNAPQHNAPGQNGSGQNGSGQSGAGQNGAARSGSPAGPTPSDAGKAAHRLPTGTYPAAAEKPSSMRPRSEPEPEPGDLFRPGGRQGRDASAAETSAEPARPAQKPDAEATVKVGMVRPKSPSDATALTPSHQPSAEKKDVKNEGAADGERPDGDGSAGPGRADRSTSTSRSG